MGHALIVEDDVDAARMMAALVTTAGFSAATAQSLRDARHQLTLQPPDLVLLDLRLPDGSGMSLLDDQALMGNTEVVLMTGHASLETPFRRCATARRITWSSRSAPGSCRASCPG